MLELLAPFSDNSSAHDSFSGDLVKQNIPEKDKTTLTIQNNLTLAGALREQLIASGLDISEI